MAKNKTQIQRLIFIDRMIRDGMACGRLANCRTIGAAYEVSYKSIMRDIDYLKNQCDAPIRYDPKRYGFYFTEENYQLPAINISESDLFAIYIARKAMEQHKKTPRSTGNWFRCSARSKNPCRSGFQSHRPGSIIEFRFSVVPGPTSIH